MQKRNGALKLFVSVVVMAFMICVAALGFGADQSGSIYDIKLGLDLAGGVSITYETVKDNPTRTEMEDTKEKLRQRAESYSSEASVYFEGSNRICVDIPDVTDANAILEKLGTQGALEFKDPDGNVILTGEHIADAYDQHYQSSTNLNGGIEHEVVLKLTSEGRQIFASETEKNVGKRISIYYDNKLVSSPMVQEKIDSDSCVINQISSTEEAQRLATTIRIGAIPLELKEVRSDVVGAKLGEQAISSSLFAGIIGLAIVILLMLVLYRIPGVAASLALITYVAMMIVVLSGFDVTLTLPGIAGMILSIGMAVDANVIIFSRIREEIGLGIPVRKAIQNGFSKALSAIVDGNVTTLIAAIVLYLMGSGTVRGFAQTLAIGIVLSMVSSLLLTRLILTAFYDLGAKKAGLYGQTKRNKTLSIVEKKKFFFPLSSIAILAAIVMLFVNASQGNMLNYSIDFVGGTSSTVTMPNEMSLEEIQSQVEPEVAATIKDAQGNISTNKVVDSKQIIIKTKTLSLEERTAMTQMLNEKFGVKAEDIQMQNISATIGAEMRRDALVAVIVSTICMLIYIWFRFHTPIFALSAVMALVHDVMIVVLFYTVLDWSVGTTFIACMLTILGYSINATIVIFDRIRENMADAQNKQKSMAEIVNESVSCTMGRSIYTSLTTLIMVVVLAIFGVAAIREFAYPLIVGVVCGCYSSVCIAGSLALVMSKLRKKSVEA